MSVPAFLDSGGIYSLADRNDQNHRRVREVYSDPGWRFVTHDYIMAEAFSLLTKRLHKRAALQTVGAFRSSSRIEVIAVGLRLLNLAWSLCERFQNKEWDWIDCISFTVMEEQGIRDAVSLDHHFSQAGYTRLI